MQQHVQFLGGEYDTKRLEAEKAVKEADELREGMESFRETLLVSCLHFRSLAGHACSRLDFRSAMRKRNRASCSPSCLRANPKSPGSARTATSSRPRSRS